MHRRPQRFRGFAPRREYALRSGCILKSHSSAKVRCLCSSAYFPKCDMSAKSGWLDGGPEYRRHWADQEQMFSRLLELCARAGGRIMSIHSRRAATQVLDALTAQPDAGLAILHWFSGTQKELSRAVGLGSWFSVGPAMLAAAKGLRW